MRCPVLTAVMSLAVSVLFICSCDLLDKEVLIDNGELETVIDSTSVRVLSSAPDSTHLIVRTGSEWTAKVKSGTEWCRISKDQGTGSDTIHVYVDENISTKMRKTTIAITAGTMTRVYWVTQGAAEEWVDITYWNRTAAQRLGLHGKVDTMTVSDSWHPVSSTQYLFDKRGNLLLEKFIENERPMITKSYRYDDFNHRLSCIVQNYEKEELRRWSYEYENKDKYVPYSVVWAESDPLAEEMEGMIVPDLSAVKKMWKEGRLEMHEDRTYTFNGESRLVITVDRWMDSLGVRVTLGADTMTVSFQYFSGCMLSLPYTSRNNVTNTTYYENGMIKMLTTKTARYEYLDNPLKLLVEKYEYTGSDEHEIDSYECDYNSYHDIMERRIRYSGQVGIAQELYTEYQYDNKFNWMIRYEEISQHERYTSRAISYHN